MKTLDETNTLLKEMHKTLKKSNRIIMFVNIVNIITLITIFVVLIK